MQDNGGVPEFISLDASMTASLELIDKVLTGQSPKIPRPPPKKKAKSEPKYCEICKITMSCIENYQSHVNGAKHKKKAEQAEKLKALSVEPSDNDNNDTFCDVCKIDCCNKIQFQQHISGRKHKIRNHSIKIQILRNSVIQFQRCQTDFKDVQPCYKNKPQSVEEDIAALEENLCSILKQENAIHSLTTMRKSLRVDMFKKKDVPGVHHCEDLRCVLTRANKFYGQWLKFQTEAAKLNMAARDTKDIKTENTDSESQKVPETPETPVAPVS